MLELLDLRANDLSGTIPAEIGNMLSLKYLLLCDNKFQGSIPTDFGKLNMLFERQYDQSCMTDVATGIDCINREVRHCIWQSSLQHLKNANSFIIPLKQKLLHFLSPFKLGEELLHGCGEKCHESLPSSKEPYIVQNIEHLPSPVRRRILLESSNLPAAPISGAPPVEITNIPSTGSGSFPAIPNSGGNDKKKQSPAPASSPPIPENKSSTTDSLPKSTDAGQTSEKVSERWRYVYVVPAGALLLTVAAAMLCMCRRPGGAAIGPWKTGISGQLQKAFVTGVPKLNRAELETACEDFSNIIDTYPHFTLFKGTLSSGVEIAVASTPIASAKDWSKHSEMLFRTKIDTMSRINHKNFVNLLGYCEEEEPFLRMLVFEYPPSGSLFERLHAKEVEHLDWTARVRAIMGVAYCLQYMHHELNPPICHPCLESRGVLLTEDNAAKIAETGIWKEIVMKAKIPDDTDPSEMPPVEPENDVYNFGILMLEIISGKLPYSEEQGSLVDLATEYLNEKRSMSYMIDPSLKSFKHNELDAICDVIQDCIHQDPRERPTMNEAIAKLREVITVSPDAATPKLSPLWWAELEILSVEAS
ncbi:protein MALE DISCOVERER 2-like isoform X2 [Magnolia sinica]|nr:protein MALE DISCOVERER 2-like isoform X2 [Magnolia sinica]